MLKKLSHVAFAVVNLDRACEFYRDVMGAEIVGRKIVPEQKAEVAFVRLQGTTKLELLAPTSDDSPIARFLAKHGPGIHHVCFEVDDLERELESLADHGVKLVDAKPRRGAEGDQIAFLHPTSTLGALIELCQTEGE
jgi:methylmalonyl-CoA/ethylmalonyl-CoA epimerase